MKVTLALLLIVAVISGSSSLKCNVFGEWRLWLNTSNTILEDENIVKDMETCGADMSCMNMVGTEGNTDVDCKF